MKQLENEYKNAISKEAADLWSRIEAGVDEYENKRQLQNEVKEEKVEIDIIKDDDERKKEDNITTISNNGTKKKIRMLYLGKGLVAVACMVFAIGGIMLLKDANIGERAYSSEPAASSEYYEPSDFTEELEISTDNEGVHISGSAETSEGVREQTDIELSLDSIDSVIEAFDCSYDDAVLIIEVLKDYDIEQPHNFVRKETEYEIPVEIIEKYGENIYAADLKDYNDAIYTAYCSFDPENNRVELVTVIYENTVIFEK